MNDDWFPHEIGRDVYEQKIVPMIAAGQIHENVTGWDITYLTDDETGLTVGYVAEHEDIWRAHLDKYWAIKITEVK